MYFVRIVSINFCDSLYYFGFSWNSGILSIISTSDQKNWIQKNDNKYHSKCDYYYNFYSSHSGFFGRIITIYLTILRKYFAIFYPYFKFFNFTGRIFINWTSWRYFFIRNDSFIFTNLTI